MWHRVTTGLRVMDKLMIGAGLQIGR